MEISIMLTINQLVLQGKQITVIGNYTFPHSQQHSKSQESFQYFLIQASAFSQPEPVC
jgi:hypothetical protein